MKDAAREIRRDEVASVHEVTKKSAPKATLIGTGIGGGAGAAEPERSLTQTMTTALRGSIVRQPVCWLWPRAGVGALVGYLVGRSGNKRVLLYEPK